MIRGALRSYISANFMELAIALRAEAQLLTGVPFGLPLRCPSPFKSGSLEAIPTLTYAASRMPFSIWSTMLSVLSQCIGISTARLRISSEFLHMSAVYSTSSFLLASRL